MTTRLSLILYALIVVLATGESARILGFFPSPAKSHLIVHCEVAAALAEAGHNVTVVASMANVNKRAKYNFIQMDFEIFDTTKLLNNKQNGLLRVFHFVDLAMQFGHMSNRTLSNSQLQQFMHDERDSFDLLILGYAINDAHLGLAAHFRCPLVLSFMIQPPYFVNSLIGNPTEISYIPSFMNAVQGPMNFWARVKNSMYLALEGTLVNFYQYLNQQAYNHHFPSDRYPSLQEMHKNISLIFANHHHISQGPIRPNVPAMIDIGGIHIKDTLEPLPADVKEFMDTAQNGVIYISFGTMIAESSFSQEKAKIMFEVLSKLPQKILWKWGDSMAVPGRADNIFYSSWLPQNEILAHPNTKLFITHGGQGSVVESEYYGVPMLGLPLTLNLVKHVSDFVRAGFGISLQLDDMSAKTLESAITEVITETKYKQAVQGFASIYRDRPMNPRQTVVFWVDYVLRHRGAKHLQSPAVHLNSFQLMSLDVIGFLLVVLGGILWIFYKLCKLCCCGRKKRTNLKVKKHKKNK